MKITKSQSVLALLLMLIVFSLSACSDNFIAVILDVESVSFNQVLKGKSNYSVEVVVIQGNSCFKFKRMESKQTGKVLELTPWGQKQVGGLCREMHTTHLENVDFLYSGPGLYKVIVNLPNGSQLIETGSLP